MLLTGPLEPHLELNLYNLSWHPILKDLMYNNVDEQQMPQNKQYDHQFKIQAVNLAQEIESAKAAKELGIPKDNLYGWMKVVRERRLNPKLPSFYTKDYVGAFTSISS